MVGPRHVVQGVLRCRTRTTRLPEVARGKRECGPEIFHGGVWVAKWLNPVDPAEIESKFNQTLETIIEKLLSTTIPFKFDLYQRRLVDACHTGTQCSKEKMKNVACTTTSWLSTPPQEDTSTFSTGCGREAPGSTRTVAPPPPPTETLRFCDGCGQSLPFAGT
jgi:hypothetical protein